MRRTFRHTHREDLVYNTVHASNDVIKNDNYNDKMVFGRRTLNQGFIQYPITRRQHIQVDGLMKIKKRDDNIKNRVIYGNHEQDKAYTQSQSDKYIENRRKRLPRKMGTTFGLNYEKILTNAQLGYKNKMKGFRTTTVAKLVNEIYNVETHMGVDKRGSERSGLYRAGFDNIEMDDKVEEQERRDGETMIEVNGEVENIDLDAPLKAFAQNNQPNNLIDDVVEEEGPTGSDGLVDDRKEKTKLPKMDTARFSNLGSGSLKPPRMRDMIKLKRK